MTEARTGVTKVSWVYEEIYCYICRRFDSPPLIIIARAKQGEIGRSEDI